MIVKLRFLGKESTPTNSPTLYASDQNSYVVQGWIVTDPHILALLDICDEETVVEVPASLLAHLAGDGLSGVVGHQLPPIAHIKQNGNLIVRGRRVVDPEALGAMDIPDHETCVEVPKAAMAALLIGG